MYKPFYSIAILVVIALVACSFGKGKMKFGVYGCMHFEPGEHQIELNDSAKQAFKDCCFTKDTQQPMNRAASGRFGTFVSIALELNPIDFKEAMKADSAVTILKEKELSVKKNLYYQYLLKKNDNYVYRTTYVEQKTNLCIIYDMASKDQEKMDSLYTNEQYLLNRLSCGK